MSRSRASASGRTWVIDPVDGTYNFVHGLTWWCSAIALVVDDEPLLGAVYHPHDDALYVGGPGLPGLEREGTDGDREPFDLRAAHATTARRSSRVGPLTFGSAGRNILRAPPIYNLNLSVYRTFSFSERIKLQFRAESDNLSNTPHFAAPNANVSAGNFLAITSANTDQRQFRFGLKLNF